MITELDWCKNSAEMRGKCDYCGKTETLLAVNKHGLWNCYECFTKMDKPKQESHEKEKCLPYERPDGCRVVFRPKNRQNRGQDASKPFSGVVVP